MTPSGAISRDSGMAFAARNACDFAGSAARVGAFVVAITERVMIDERAIRARSNVSSPNGPPWRHEARLLGTFGTIDVSHCAGHAARLMRSRLRSSSAPGAVGEGVHARVGGGGVGRAAAWVANEAAIAISVGTKNTPMDRAARKTRTPNSTTITTRDR